jgi:hypothetical protein
MPVNGWWTCSKCVAVFFGGDGYSVCPAGGQHSKLAGTESAVVVYDDIEPTVWGEGQPGWRSCTQCQGLFFIGNNTMGVCPAHSAANSRNYVLSENPPASGTWQGDWKWCSNCSSLFFNPNTRGFNTGRGWGLCAANQEGLGHYDIGSRTYILPTSASSGGQPGWRWCNKCQCLFFAGDGSLGGCPAGGSHHLMGGADEYFLPSSGAGQDNWRWCGQCECLFFAANDLGVCPTPSGHHDSGGGEFFVPLAWINFNPFQYSGYSDVSAAANVAWCRRCQVLFNPVVTAGYTIGGSGFPVCPSRAGNRTNQPIMPHDWTGSGGYSLPAAQDWATPPPPPPPPPQGQGGTPPPPQGPPQAYDFCIQGTDDYGDAFNPQTITVWAHSQFEADQAAQGKVASMSKGGTRYWVISSGPCP